MKLVICYCTANFYINSNVLQLRIPLNPILGETLQRELPTGERIYGEQISHHPPITAFQVYGKNDEFHHYGHYQYKGWLNGLNSIGGNKQGTETLKFADGTTYKWTNFPTLSTEGLASSSPFQVYYDKFTIIDETNDITAEVHFNPNYNNSYSGLAAQGATTAIAGAYAAGGMLKSGLGKGLGKLWGKKKEDKKEEVKEEKKEEESKVLDPNAKRGDELAITIKKTSDKSLIAKGEGSWLSHIEIGGATLWRID